MGFEISSVIAGVGAGITFSVSSYWKKKDQEFDWGKLGATVAIGAITGVVTGLLDMPISTVNEFVVNLGAVPIVENIVKIVWRKILGIGSD